MAQGGMTLSGRGAEGGGVAGVGIDTTGGWDGEDVVPPPHATHAPAHITAAPHTTNALRIHSSLSPTGNRRPELTIVDPRERRQPADSASVQPS
jgi:hypothetical protein